MWLFNQKFYTELELYIDRLDMVHEEQNKEQSDMVYINEGSAANTLEQAGGQTDHRDKNDKNCPSIDEAELLEKNGIWKLRKEMVFENYIFIRLLRKIVEE